MERNRLINFGIIGAIIAIGALGWFIGVSPVLDQVSLAKASAQTVATANASNQARLATLKHQFANIDPLKTKLAGLQASVPAGADISAFLAEINSLSASTGASLTSLTVDPALTFVDPSAAAATAAVPAAGTTPSASPSPSDTAAATTMPTTPVDTGPSSRLVAIPVKVLVSGSYDSVMAFGGALQTGQRLFFVSTMTVTANDDGSGFVGELDGNVYALPPVGGVQATTPATPTPTQTPAPSTTPTPSSTVPAKPSGTPTSTPTPTGTAKP
jgi:Tfp pilus assembly protein PilO